MSGWRIQRRHAWWDVRIWTPRVVRWVFYLRLVPPKVQAQRVLTDAEYDQVIGGTE